MKTILVLIGLIIPFQSWGEGIEIGTFCYIARMAPRLGACQISCVSKKTLDGEKLNIVISSEDTQIESGYAPERAKISYYSYLERPSNELAYQLIDADSGYHMDLKIFWDTDKVEPFQGFKSINVSSGTTQLHCEN